MPPRSAPPQVVGRWSILPLPEPDPTVRAAAQAEFLLDRYGVVTRGAVQAEELPGGFALAYKTLAALEESGRARRGYFIERLGAAQFSTSGTVDRLRTFARAADDDAPIAPAIVLAATDPANPYGAALAWPAAEGGHRPGRKAGALVVLVDGALAVYVERGGKTVLLCTQQAAVLDRAAAALAEAVRRRAVPVLAVEKIDGEFAIGAPFGRVLERHGFLPFPKGVRLRA